MITFPRQKAYQEGGYEWLGSIPENWQTIRAKYVLREVDERSQTGDEELLSVSHLTGVTPRAEKNVNMFLAEDYSGSKLCQPDDVVINTMWAWMGALGVSQQEGLVSPSYGVYRPYGDNKVFPKFLDSLLRTPQYIAEYIRRSTGVHSSRLRLYPDQFLDIPLLLPPLEEQKRIVEFLDRTTTEIDRAIAQKQRLIELLQEQKAILINQAVTKGLNPNVSMRDSGIEWIGEIPEHWSIKRLGLLSNLLQTGPFGSQLHQEDYIEGGIPAINPSQLIDGEIRPDYKISVSEKTALKLERHRLVEGDIVFGRRGEMGRCGLVAAQEVGWLCGTGSILFRPKTEVISPRFALAVLRSHCIKSTLEYISVGATMDNLNTAILSKISLPIPPLDEQTQIVVGIKKIKEEFSELISRQLKEIDLLNEMRQVMIASAVTGKIKV